MRQEHFETCSPENEINDYLKRVFLSFNIIDNYVDITNYTNPIKKYIYSITGGITQDSYSTNNLNFNPGLIISYDHLFRDKAEEKITYLFHQNSKSTTILENTNIISCFVIWIQNSQHYYQRRYQKLQNVLSNIGGIANLILIIAQCINYSIARFNMLTDTQDLLKSIIKKNDTIYENLIKSHSSRKVVKMNILRKNEDNSTLKLFGSNNNIKKIINTENSENEKEEDKKIIHKIKVINSNNNNLGEETNRINKNEENREQQISKKKSEENLEKIKRMTTRNYILRDFSLIKEKDNFNCFSYFIYIFLCKRKNSNIKYYEELRRLIISEECMIQNYLNIHKLLDLNGT